MTCERDIEKYLVKRVKELGGEIRKVKWIGRRHAPDRAVFLNGVHWPEVKAPGEKPRAGQVREHERMRKHGANVYTLDSFESVDSFIARIV